MTKQRPEELIKLLYVSGRESHGFLGPFSGHRGWRVISCETLTISTLLDYAPDLVAVDIESIGFDRAVDMVAISREKGMNFIAGVFALLDLDPGPKERYELLSAGFDDLVMTPLSVMELGLKVQIHLDKRQLKRSLAFKTDKLDSAVVLLKKFKVELEKTRRAFSREKSLLHNTLKQINMMTMERDRLKGEVWDLGNRFQKNTRGVEKILSSMIESKNESNKGHLRRIGDIAAFVGDRLGINTVEKEAMEQAVLLHEAGLLFVPGSILLKDKESLTEYEKDLFIKAPSTGAAFLKGCPGLERAADIICHINENVDGSGRPGGLKRRQIPLPSRILAGAVLLDHFATSEPRPSPEKIPLMLENLSGTRLDPKVVNLLELYVVTCMNGHSGLLKEVGLHQLKPGMIIGAGVYANTGTKLLSTGALLTEASITMLIRYNREYPLAETVFIKVK